MTNMENQDDKTLLQSLSNLCLNDKLADVYFKCQTDSGEGVQFPAHKLILSMRSSVFQTMFFGSFDGEKSVEVSDVPADIFESFLRYIYTDEITIDGNNVNLFLYTADKYQLLTLKHSCQQYLENHLNVDTACTIMNSADTFSIQSLVTKVLHYIAANANIVFRTPQFTSLSSKNLERILSSDDLTVPEVEVYHAAIRWAVEKCRSRSVEQNIADVRMVLGDLFYQIRFSTMTLEDFSNVAVKSGILTDQEQLQFYKLFTVKEKGSEIEKFVSDPRSGLFVELILETIPRNTNEFMFALPSDFSEEYLHLSAVIPSCRNINLIEIEITETIVQNFKCKDCNAVPTFVVKINRLISPPDLFRQQNLKTENYSIDNAEINLETRCLAVNYPIRNDVTVNVSVGMKRRCEHCGNYRSAPSTGAPQNPKTVAMQNIEFRVECKGYGLVRCLKFQNV